MSEPVERLHRLLAMITEAAARSGRSAATLVAVSKTHPPEAVLELLEAGQTLYGESRIQEARAKISLLPARARWHFIGHLQKNKIRQALALDFELYHGIDSLELALELDRQAAATGARPQILLEVNVAGESSKFGFSPTLLPSQIETLLGLERVQIQGLMTIAPLAASAEHSRPHFIALRQLRDQLETEFGLRLPELSMGMSNDFEVAIEEGASLVRVGSALFGSRRGPGWRPSPESATLD